MTSHPPDDLATAVGWIAIEAARVELVAAQLEAAMIGTPAALTFTVGQGWGITKRAIEALVKLRRDRLNAVSDGPAIAVLDQIAETIRRTQALMERRNDVVHGLWEGSWLGADHSSLRLKRWGDSNRRHWTMAELRQLRHDLEALHAEIDSHFDRESAAAARNGAASS